MISKNGAKGMIRGAKYHQRGHSWEQWAILVVASFLLVINISWGAPNKKRMECLIGSEPLTTQQQQLLDSVRHSWHKKTEERKAREARDILHGIKVVHFQDRVVYSGAIATPEERLADFRTFVTSLLDFDEINTFSMNSA
jgi:hypothetical protein